MNLPQECRETFLDGVIDAYFYPMEGTSLPVPFNVGQILQINDCSFAAPVLHVATTGEDYVIADSITAKVTPEIAGNGTVYTFDISANITEGGENVREAYKNMRGNDYYVVLRKQDGSYYLCYTLPNTFVMRNTVTVSMSEEQRTMSVGLKAMSEFIPITIKQ